MYFLRLLSSFESYCSHNFGADVDEANLSGFFYLKSTLLVKIRQNARDSLQNLTLKVPFVWLLNFSDQHSTVVQYLVAGILNYPYLNMKHWKDVLNWNLFYEDFSSEFSVWGFSSDDKLFIKEFNFLIKKVFVLNLALTQQHGSGTLCRTLSFAR